MKLSKAQQSVVDAMAAYRSMLIVNVLGAKWSIFLMSNSAFTVRHQTFALMLKRKLLKSGGNLGLSKCYRLTELGRSLAKKQETRG